MAIQFTDFSRIPTQEPAFANLLGDMLQGYKTQREPTRIRQDEESRMRDNAIKAIQQKFLPQEKQSALDNLRLDISAKKQAAMQEALLNQAYGESLNGSAQPSSPGLAQAPASTPSDFKGIPFRMSEPGVNKGQAMTENAAQAQGSVSHPYQSQGGEVISEGSPSMYGLDKLYESNPMVRPFMEKKGHKKKEDIQYDKESGTTRITTTWPSGLTSVRTVGGKATDYSPLTSTGKKDMQSIIGTTASVVKSLDGLINSKEIPGALNRFGDTRSNYDSKVIPIIEQLSTIYKLAKIERTYEDITKMVKRGFNESNDNYKKRLKEVKEDAIDKAKMAQESIKKGVDLSEGLFDSKTPSENKSPTSFDFSQYPVVGG